MGCRYSDDCDFSRWQPQEGRTPSFDHRCFVGWLVTDGYMAYRSHKWRQRCIAHLIRKAVGISEGVDPEAGNIGEWLLKELRRLIKTMADGGEEARVKCNPILARLKRACLIGKKTDHSKLKALAAEILNDWDAVVAFVKNPGLPPTNNLAERMLRHAVILRRISFGTRTSEGSLAFADLLSVIETCRAAESRSMGLHCLCDRQWPKGIAPSSYSFHYLIA